MGDRIFQKLQDLEGLRRSPIFVFAADALAAGGVRSLGQESHPRPHSRTRPEFLQLIRDLVADGMLDGVLMTPADAEVLALEERLFERTPVTPMVRMNAETHIWNPRHGTYRFQPSMPFQTLPVEFGRYCNDLVCGVQQCYVRIGLYSITLNNDVERDLLTLSAYLQFARECARYPDFFHVLEVFLPNVNLPGMDRAKRGEYVADSIVRTMSYLRKSERPLFIKTEFTTPEVWQELCSFDPTLVIGALGGPRENARSTLQLAHNVVKYGGRAILFGRCIFQDESPRLICRALRKVLDGTSVDEAFEEYKEGLRRELRRSPNL